jgi:HK97 gp10 family phage protein
MAEAPLIQVNWRLLRERLVAAAVDAVNSTVEKGMARAQKDAPVRKVFSGGRRSIRFRTAAEIRQDRRLRSRLGLAPEMLGESRTVETRTRLTRAGVPISRTLGNRANRVAATGLPSNNSDIRVLRPANQRRLHFSAEEYGLTARGRYELRAGRAISRETIALRVRGISRGGLELTTVSRLGGRLRATIRVEEASEDQYPVIKASLLAGSREVPYAKFQELGTRHNPAHPFLRPRLPEWQVEIRQELRRSYGRLGR